MPILTLDRTKELLLIEASDSSNDSLINLLIPIVQQKIITYCNNYFLDIDYRLTTDTFAFVAATPSITDSDDGFIDAGFIATNDIRVRGSKLNDKVFLINSLIAGVITVDSIPTLIEEENDDTIEISITKVVFPVDLEIDAVNLLYRYMVKSGKLVESESLPGGYSVKFQSMENLLKPFNLYRRPYI